MTRVRGVAQSEARGVWDAEVAGSSPATPTRSSPVPARPAARLTSSQRTAE